MNGNGGNGNGKLSNPPSGTIVDDVVTLPERYDFFLISQSVRQGTVNPTSYNVIEDKSGLKPDQIQKLTYKLTHLYYNWSGTVRVSCILLKFCGWRDSSEINSLSLGSRSVPVRPQAGLPRGTIPAQEPCGRTRKTAFLSVIFNHYKLLYLVYFMCFVCTRSMKVIHRMSIYFSVF